MYVTLPWWVGPSLRRWIISDMSGQMGVGVHIEKMSLSWSRGVEIDGLTINSPEGFDGEPMAYVKRLRADFSPLRFVFQKRFGWMELDRPRLSVHLDRDGNVNIAPLAGLGFDADADRISVRQAIVTLVVPDTARPVQLSISDAQFQAGRLHKLGRVTMSAALEQTSQSAAVSLHLAARQTSPTAADASFNFVNVDLEQLPLVQMLRLLDVQTRRIAGRCDGSLDFQVNRQGKVDRFGFNIIVHDLDVHPTVGPKIPLIAEAHFTVSAAYDPLAPGGGEVELQSLSIALPGVKLSGKAMLSEDVGLGRPEAIRSIDLAGSVHPARLASLLRGRRELFGDLVVDGPVRVKLSARNDGMRFYGEFGADSSDVVIRRGERILKPLGRALILNLRGELDRRNWSLRGASGEIVLGANRFTTSVSMIANLQGMILHWAAGSGTTRPNYVMAQLENAELSGLMEIRDVESLLDLLGDSGGVAEASLDGGVVKGQWSVGPDGGHQRVRVSLLAPADADISVGDYFAKRPGADMALDLSAVVDANIPGLTDLTARFSVGDAAVQTTAAQARLVTVDRHTGTLSLSATGQFNLQHPTAFLQCCPKLGVPVDGLAGGIDGEYEIRLSPTSKAVKVAMDAADLEVRLGEFVTKSASQPGSVEVDWQGQASAPPGERNRVAFVSRFAGVELTGRCFLPDGSASADGQIRLAAEANIFAPGLLADHSPHLQAALAGGQVGGSAQLTGQAIWRAGTLETHIDCDADGLEFVSGDRRRRKKAGVPLRVVAAVKLAGQDGGVLRVEVDSGELRLGESNIHLAGTIARWPWSTDGFLRQVAASQFNIHVDGVCAADAAIGELLVELNPPMRRSILAGSFKLDGQVVGDGERISVNCSIDADDLLLRGPGPLAKPAGLTGDVGLDIVASVDLSQLEVRHFQIRLGELTAHGDATAGLVTNNASLPISLGDSTARVVLWTEQAGQMYQLLPGLEPFDLSGRAGVEVEWSGSGGGGEMVVADLTADQLRGRYRGKDVFIAGRLHAEGVRFGEKGTLEIDAVKTDSLELRAGENHLWLIADLVDLPSRPAGTFHVLADWLNDRELIDWLTPSKPDTTRPAHMTPEQVSQLRDRARGIVSDAKTILLAAGLAGRVSIRRLRTFDAAVGQYYDVRNMEATASVNKGRAKLGYAVGINGGTLRTRYEIDLTAESPTVIFHKEINSVIAAENIQPQMAMYFPGNNVHGLFSRKENTTVPLHDAVANAIDDRYPLHPVGSAKTIAEEGVLVGRAAPKFVTKIFRGLNLARYKYDTMTAFVTLKPDGTAVNEMLFNGQTYDICIEGATDPNNIGKYQISLILWPQSADWAHNWRQFRMPIVKFRARIEGGKFHDQVVSYPWPNETLGAIFVKNNIVYRLWLNSRKK